ncbi:MAG: serine hydrolase, partial [Pseudomonadales bacterium]
MKSCITVIVIIILLALFWVGLPFYQFFAYRGQAPMLPTLTWQLQADVPTSQQVVDTRYKEAGSIALAKLAAHGQQISAPAISAAVAIDGQVVWAGASGWADINKQAPATPASRFRLGST